MRSKNMWVTLFTTILLLSGAALAKTELTFYYPVAVAGPLAKIMSGMVSKFNASHSEIRVTPVFAGNYDQTMQKVQAAIQGGTTPDVAVLLSTDLFTLISMDAVTPIQSFADQTAAGKAYLQDFLPAFMLNSRFQNTVYTIPFQRSTPVLYFNEQLFKQAGLDPTKAPRNWDELYQFARKITTDSAGRHPGDAGFDPTHVVRWGVLIPSSGYPYWIFQSFIAQGGQAQFSSADGTKVYLDTPVVKRALQFYLKLQRGYATPTGITSWGDAPTNLLAGKAGMIYHSTGSLTFMRKNATFPLGVAFMPADKSFGTPTGGGNLYIFKHISAAAQKAAWTFVQWMTSPSESAYWSMQTGYVGTRESTYATPAYQAYAAKVPAALVAKRQLAYAQAELATFDRQQIYQIVNDALQEIISGQNTNIDAVLKGAQQRVDQVLAPYVKRYASSGQ